MATKHRNLSQLNSPLPSAEEMKFGIVVAEWNPEVTEGLLSGAVHTLRTTSRSSMFRGRSNCRWGPSFSRNTPTWTP